ncbi:Neurotransmitter-gated ion-channel ligand-binding domain [Trinorchestia longiramus]|nr:Neurotransmitter-gated ion-channel ligand-binding domain [Trinorchestia longiramus]
MRVSVIQHDHQHSCVQAAGCLHPHSLTTEQATRSDLWQLHQRPIITRTRESLASVEPLTCIYRHLQVPSNTDLSQDTHRPDEVWMIEFMARGDLTGTSIQDLHQQVLGSEKSIVYVTRKVLNFGHYSPQASLCLWLHLNNRRYTDVIWTLHQQKTSLNFGYKFISLGVFSSKLVLQTSTCNILFDYFVERRKWIHLCVSMSNELVTYADGEVIEQNVECPFNGTMDLTTENSTLDLGNDRTKGKPMSGKVADVRFYLVNISLAEVKAAMTFGNSSLKYIEIIDGDQTEPTGVDIKPIFKSELTIEETTDDWMQITTLLTSADAESVCLKVGGSLLHVPSISDEAIIGFTINVLGESLSNFWVKSDNGSSCVFISVSVSGVWQDTPEDCSFLRRSICSIPSSKTFYFIGMEYTDETYRTPMKKVRDALAWDAEYDWRLEYSESDYTLYFMNSISLEVYANTDFMDMNELMGRTSWTMQSTPPKQVTFTLTSCDVNQFTCSNGECIDLLHVCNFIVDCADFTDEQLCNYTQKRPSYYDNQLSGQGKLQVNLTLDLLRIQELDMQEGTLKVSVRAVAMWRDPRVVFHNIHPGNATLVPKDDATFYWQPNIVMEGVINEDTNALSMDAEPGKMYITADTPGKPATFMGNEVLEYGGEQVVIMHEKRDIITITCPVDLFNYPFDVQTCNMTLLLEGKVLPDAEWQPAPDAVLNFTETSLQLFEFIHYKRYLQHDNGNPVMFEIRIARRYGSHVLVTFLPCFVLQLIGLSVFAIPLDDFSDRLTVSISCLIVMAALFTQISSTLPVSADPKMIDVWMFVHVFMLAVVFFAMIVLNAVTEDGSGTQASLRPKSWKVSPIHAGPQPHHSQNNSRRQKANKWTAVTFVLSYLLFVLIFLCYIFVVRNNVLSDTDA